MSEKEPSVTLWQRTLYVSGEIDDQMVMLFMAALTKLDEEEGDIRIVLNSSGGDEYCGYAMYDAITMCKHKVIIDGYGAVQSMAAAILQAGDVRRLAPSASFMIHNGSTPVDSKDGDADQDHVIALAEQLKKDNQRYYAILAKGSQQGLEAIADWCRDETFFDAEEAVACGFADEVIKPLKDKGKRRKRK